MADKSKGHQQRLAREARASALIGILCAAAWLLAVRYIGLFGEALRWISAVGFLAGLAAAVLISVCFYESKIAAAMGAAAYLIVSGIGLLAGFMAK